MFESMLPGTEGKAWNRPSTVVGEGQLAGELKIVAAILERPLIEKILMHLGLQAPLPPRALAREPAPHHAG